MEISEDTTISSLVKEGGFEDILKKHKIPCVGCPMMQFEGDLTIKRVCKIYGLDKESLLKDLKSYERKNQKNEKN